MLEKTLELHCKELKDGRKLGSEVSNCCGRSSWENENCPWALLCSGEEF